MRGCCAGCMIGSAHAASHALLLMDLYEAPAVRASQVARNTHVVLPCGHPAGGMVGAALLASSVLLLFRDALDPTFKYNNINPTP